MKLMLRSLLLAVSIIASGTHAAPFTQGNIVVYRVGDGATALANTGNAVFLDEFSPSGALVQSVALPAAGASASIVASGTATSEGLLTRSADKRYLLATGYRVASLPGPASLSGTTGTAVPRVVARVDAAGVVDSSTALTDFASGNNPRSATSTNGTDLWVAGGAGGPRYATLGATTSTQISTTLTNLRQLAIFSDQLYTSTSSGSAVRVGTIGTGLPTTAGQTITNLPGFATTGSPYAFFLADLDASVAGPDTLYVADDGSGLQKFSLVGGNWVANGTVGTAADAYRGLTASVSSTTVTLYATRKGTELVSLSDASGYNAMFAGTPTVLSTAGANINFRGVALAPESGVVVNAPITPNCPLVLAAVQGTAASANLSARDADGTVTSATITSVPTAGISLTGLVPAAAAGGTASVQLAIAGTVAIGSYPVTIQFANTDAPAQTASCTVTVNVANVERIYNIQGAAHVSPRAGQSVNSVIGIVTQLRNNGFFMQDETGDGNDATSDAIFVFTSSAPAVAVGDKILVSGNVSEFRPGCNGCAPSAAAFANLTTTQITAPTIAVQSSANPLPAPIVIGPGGRVPPAAVIHGGFTSTTDVELGGAPFLPATNGLDFYESLEGMRVTVTTPTVVGPTQRFGGSSNEIVVVPQGASLRTARGGILLRADDSNPERIFIQGATAQIPDVNVGDTLSTVTGVIGYDFANYKLLVNAAVTATPGGLARETTTLSGDASRLTIASFNVENLSTAGPASRFTDLANAINVNLNKPDIVALVEIQDNNGQKAGNPQCPADGDGIVAADQTYSALTTAISAAGGPAYQVVQIDPVDCSDGGAPTGNIRVGFLYNSARVSFTPRPGGTATVANTVLTGPQLQFNPGRIDPSNAAFASSRKPLAAEFTFAGKKLFVVATHMNSKGGDQPLFGRFQPPERSSEVQRNQQAAIINGFVQQLLAQDVNARVAVLGDMNDFEFSTALATLRGTALVGLSETLPVNERYTYNFQGNAQSLDHILVSKALRSGAAYDVVHINSEFFNQLSDHDPQVAQLVFNDAPTIVGLPSAFSGVIGDATDYGAGVGLPFTVSDPDGTVPAPTVTVVNQAIASAAVEGTAGNYRLKITPLAVGFTDVVIKVTDLAGVTTEVRVAYAASANAGTADTVWPIGAADASTAVALDAEYMFVADDEDQKLRLFRRGSSGPALSSFDFTTSLGLTDLAGGGQPREVDIEGSTRIGNRIFWMGSHSNSSGGASRPNRQRIFATDVSGSGAVATLSYVGRYDFLRADLVAWDQANAHARGANYFGLAASTASGVAPEAVGGFNIEALTVAPDSSTVAYLGLRAPLSDTTARTKALVIPINNFAGLAANGGAAGTAQIGAPIELSLGGRGIRSMECSATDCLIVAGPAGASGDFKLYTWSGKPADPARPRAAVLTGLNPEGIAALPAGSLTDATKVQLISDQGDTVYYGNEIIAKDLPQANHKKFRVDTVTIGALSGDLAPDAFAFTPQTKVQTNSTITSNSVTPAGYDAPADVSVSGGEYSIGCTAIFTNSAGLIAPGQSVCVRHTSATTGNAVTTTTITIGGIAATFQSTTGSGTTQDGVGLFVEQIYQALLGRPSDAGGKQFWSAQIKTLQGLQVSPPRAAAGVAFLFINTPEFVGRSLDDAAFVRAVYAAVLNRPPSTSELAQWTDLLAAGIPRDAALGGLLNTAEASTTLSALIGGPAGKRDADFVVDLYSAFLLRPPEQDGINFWLQRLRDACAGDFRSGATFVSRFFSFSPEYVTRNANNARAVADAYLGILGRAPERGGFDYWKNRLDTNTVTRAGVVDLFLIQPEYLQRLEALRASTCSAP